MWKKVILVQLLCLSVMSINIDQDVEATNKLSEIRSLGSTNAFIVDLAQISQDVKSPMDELKLAVQKLNEDMQNKLTQIEDEFQTKQNQYQSISQKLQLDIGQASIDIAQSADQVDNVLISGKESTDKKLKQVESYLKDNRLTIQRDTLQRNKEQEQYTDTVKQCSGAINGVDEALQLVQGLLRGGISFAEAPMKKTIQYIENKLSTQNEFSPLISSLLELADSIRDQQSLKQLRDLLNSLRTMIVDSINSESENEHKNAKMWEERQLQLEAEYSQFQKQINDGVYEINIYQGRLIIIYNKFIQRKDQTGVRLLSYQKD